MTNVYVVVRYTWSPDRLSIASRGCVSAWPTLRQAEDEVDRLKHRAGWSNYRGRGERHPLRSYYSERVPFKGGAS